MRWQRSFAFLGNLARIEDKQVYDDALRVFLLYCLSSMVREVDISTSPTESNLSVIFGDMSEVCHASVLLRVD